MSIFDRFRGEPVEENGNKKLSKIQKSMLESLDSSIQVCDERIANLNLRAETIKQSNPAGDRFNEKAIATLEGEIGPLEKEKRRFEDLKNKVLSGELK